MLNRKSVEARLVEKARLEPNFRRMLIAEPARTIAKEFGVEIPSSLKLRVLEETDRELYLVLPPSMPIADLAPRATDAVVGGLQGQAEENSDPGNEKRPWP